MELRDIAASSGPGVVRARDDRHDVRRFAHEAMATVFEVHCVHDDERYAAQAAEAAFEIVDRLERELSRFLPNSDIARINHLDPGGTARVGASALECLSIARYMFDLTGGAFDVSMGTGLPSLELDADRFEVRATAAGVRIDLGGIGKGYAVDRMAEALEEWGVTHAVLHGGFSSLLALEPPPGQDGWPLTLSDTNGPARVLIRLSARQTALAASGVRKKDHIVDPRTGEPCRGRLAAWGAVPRPEANAGAEQRGAAATVTDALTTALMLLGTDDIERLCESSPGLEAWILPEPAGDRHGESRLLHFGGAAD